MNSKLLCSTLAGLCLLAVPAAGQQVTKVIYKAPRPAKVGDAAKLKRIAVLQFDGNEGGKFAGTLMAELRSAMFNNLPHFDVISADGVVAEAPPPPPPPAPAPAGKGKKVVSTIKVLPVADTPVARAIRIGRAAQLDGVIIGDVTAAIERRNYSESRSNGNGGTVDVPCQSATVNFTVVPSMINVQTGQVVYSRTVATRDSFTVCAGKVDEGMIKNFARDLGSIFGVRKTSNNASETRSDKMKVESELDLITKVSKAAAEQILKDIAPSNQDTEVFFYPDAPKLPKPQRADFLNAATFAKASRFDRACAAWEALKSPETERNLQLMFNIAICAWLQQPDNPADALRRMNDVEAMEPRFNKDIDAAKKMLEKAVADKGELAKQVK